MWFGGRREWVLLGVRIYFVFMVSIVVEGFFNKSILD